MRTKYYCAAWSREFTISLKHCEIPPALSLAVSCTNAIGRFRDRKSIFTNPYIIASFWLNKWSIYVFAITKRQKINFIFALPVYTQLRIAASDWGQLFKNSTFRTWKECVIQTTCKQVSKLAEVSLRKYHHVPDCSRILTRFSVLGKQTLQLKNLACQICHAPLRVSAALIWISELPGALSCRWDCLPVAICWPSG